MAEPIPLKMLVAPLLLAVSLLAGACQPFDEAPADEQSSARATQPLEAPEDLTWTRLENQPSFKVYSAAATYGDQTVLFGGADYHSLLFDETWVWNGERWSLANPATRPPRRSWHAMAGLGAKAVLFGGRANNGSDLADTWEWDGANWVQKSPANSPSQRTGHAMATFGSKVLLFGGNNDRTYYNDLWEWDGTNWTQLDAGETLPSPRASAGIAASGNQLLLFGGRGTDGTYATDTWLWDGTTWRVAEGLSAAPAGRAFFTMASPGGKPILFGGRNGTGTNEEILGDMWRWSGSAWEQLAPARAPSARAAHALAPRGTEGLLLFGGTTAESISNETWSWAGGDWTLEDGPTVSPSPRFGHTMAQLVPGETMLLGGDGDITGATWLLDDEGWHFATAEAPNGVHRFRPAIAPLGGRQMLLFGGNDGEKRVKLGDTLIWKEGAWREVTGLTAHPSARYYHAMAALGEGNVLLFGGFDTAAIGDTWLWEKGAWAQQTQSPSSPPARYNHVLAPLGAGKALLFGGTGEDAQVLGDTWLWEDGAWHEVTGLEISPSARRNGAIAPLGEGRLLLFGGGTQEGQGLGDTWLWADGAWTELTATAGAPSARMFHTMAAWGTGEIVLFSGESGGYFENDLWSIGTAELTKPDKKKGTSGGCSASGGEQWLAAGFATVGLWLTRLRARRP